MNVLCEFQCFVMPKALTERPNYLVPLVFSTFFIGVYACITCGAIFLCPHTPLCACIKMNPKSSVI